MSEAAAVGQERSLREWVRRPAATWGSDLAKPFIALEARRSSP